MEQKGKKENLVFSFARRKLIRIREKKNKHMSIECLTVTERTQMFVQVKLRCFFKMFCLEASYAHHYTTNAEKKNVELTKNQY